MSKTYISKTLPSPVGALTLVASDTGLAAVLWENDDPRRVWLNHVPGDFISVAPAHASAHDVLRETARQLTDYFAGRRTSFSLPLDFQGTDFQKAVWQALLTIPFGETRSYADIARQIGNPRAVRAVGTANGRNPISIVAPCHRVIGTDGKLTGFAGGLDAKALLLGLETAAPRFRDAA